MNAISAVAGALLVVLVVTQVFTDLFHPAGSGALSDWLARHLFNLLRRTDSLLPLAGPLSVVVTIATWVLLLTIGFALVFYGSVPDGFRTSIATVPSASHRFLTAAYFSAQTITTLAFGDIVANSTAMRAAVTLEGLIGFGVLTASVSSIVLLYPALSRMRLLARGTRDLVRAEQMTGVAVAVDGSEPLLAHLARDVTNTRIDLVHFPIIYFFATREPAAALPCAIGDLSRFARQGLALDRTPVVRLAAAALEQALDDLAAVLASRLEHVDGEDRDAVFRAYARDHRLEQAHVL